MATSHPARSSAVALVRALGPAQRSAVGAGLLAWTGAAFGFFVFVLEAPRIAAGLHSSIVAVAWAVAATLLCRPLGAMTFGFAGVRFGRRAAMAAAVLACALLSLASALVPGLPALIATRALYGVAMGGAWTLGTTAAIEAVPFRSRGLAWGLIQTGYALGALLAALTLLALSRHAGWRWLLVAGALPALGAPAIRLAMPAAPPPVAPSVQERARTRWQILRSRWALAVYIAVLVATPSLAAHGSQDLHATFLAVQHHASPTAIGLVEAVAATGGVAGGLALGSVANQVGRRAAIVTTALLVIPVLPLFAFSLTLPLLALGAFLVQFAVQGIWTVMPAYVDELSPDGVLGTLPGVEIQLGPLLAAGAIPLQAAVAAREHGHYGTPLFWVTLVALAGVAVVTLLGEPSRGFRRPGGHDAMRFRPGIG